jgi:quercetin dioxygenase-like cupin family protein
VVHDKVMEALQKGGTLATGADFRVTGGHRDKAGRPEAHDKDTEIVLVMEGEATYVTGGTMVDGKELRPGERAGSGIQGGETRHLTKGDVIVIPAGTPHWFKEVPRVINYYDVKVHKP